MYLNEQFPMVCLGCLENKYFPRHLIFPVSWFSTKPSGIIFLKCYTMATIPSTVVPNHQHLIAHIQCIQRRLCTSVAKSRGFPPPLFCLTMIARHSIPINVSIAHIKHGRTAPQLRTFLVPIERFRGILFAPSSHDVKEAQGVHGIGVALFCRRFVVVKGFFG